MTLVADPPVAGEPTRPTRRPASSGGTIARWRFAARLARREVRRRPGRTALVAALISVPVLGMTLASVLRTSIDDPWAETFARRSGPGDLRVDAQVGPGGLDADDLLAQLPPGASSLTSERAWVRLGAADGGELPYVQLTDLDLDDPLAAGVVELLDGSAPGPDEVLLDPRSADSLGVDVGDELVLARPDVTWTVSGIGRMTDG